MAALGLKWWWVFPCQLTARRNSPSTGHPSKGSPSLKPMPSKGKIHPRRWTTIRLNLWKQTPPQHLQLHPHEATPSSSSTNIREAPPQSPPSPQSLSPNPSRRTATVTCTSLRWSARARSWAPGSPARRTLVGCGPRNQKWSVQGPNRPRPSGAGWLLRPLLSRASRWIYRSAGLDTASRPSFN